MSSSRKHDLADRAAAVREVEESGLPLAKIAERHRVPVDTLLAWCAENRELLRVGLSLHQLWLQEQSPLVRAGGSSRHYPTEAMRARAGTVAQRRQLAVEMSWLLQNGTRFRQDRLPQAEALHLVAFTLSGELPASELIAILAPAVIAMRSYVVDDPELLSYCGLITRTISMASSKLDRYDRAFDAIVMALEYAYSSQTIDDFTVLRGLEAKQQVYLQESGQYARNVEAALIEQDPGRRTVLLEGIPPQRWLGTRRLHAMRQLAFASAECGRRAVGLMNVIAHERGLPAVPDLQNRQLSTQGWFATAAIMFMRAILLHATLELCENPRAAGRWVDRVPTLFEEVLKPGPALLEWHQMGLVQVALHYSFLRWGQHPDPIGVWNGRQRLRRKDIPDCLRPTRSGQLDVKACSTTLIKTGWNANFLDNVGYYEPYQVLVEHGGGGQLGFADWVVHHNAELAKRYGALDDSDEAIEQQLRLAKLPTVRALQYTSQAVIQSGRFPLNGGPA
jgi:transposase-like protein